VSPKYHTYLGTPALLCALPYTLCHTQGRLMASSAWVLWDWGVLLWLYFAAIVGCCGDDPSPVSTTQTSFPIGITQPWLSETELQRRTHYLYPWIIKCLATNSLSVETNHKADRIFHYPLDNEGKDYPSICTLCSHFRLYPTCWSHGSLSIYQPSQLVSVKVQSIILRPPITWVISLFTWTDQNFWLLSPIILSS